MPNADEITSVGGAIAVIIATIIMYIQTNKTNKTTKKSTEEVKSSVEDTKQQVDQVKATLTENNGGSHAKDQFDRIESMVFDVVKRTERMENRQDFHDRRIGRMEEKLDTHLLKGETNG